MNISHITSVEAMSDMTYARELKIHSHIATVVGPPSLKSFANQKTCQITVWSC